MDRLKRAPASGRKGSVLLAGHLGTDPRGIGRRLVAATGCEMVVVSLEEALEVTQPGAQDVVLVDLTDPAAGTALARELRERHPDLALVGLVGEAARQDVAAALAAGFSSLGDLEASTADLGLVIGQTLVGRHAVTPELVEPVVEKLTEAVRPSAPGVHDGASRSDRDDVYGWFAGPGALEPVFQPVADVRDRRVVGHLALVRFSRFAPEETASRFERVTAAGRRRELELVAAAEILTRVHRLPAHSWLFVKFRSATVASGEVEDLFGVSVAGRTVIELSGGLDESEEAGFWRSVRYLRERGVRFSVDATGVGLGSLDRILELAPSFVRLPGAAIRGVDRDRTRRAVAHAMAVLAEQVGAQVLADAVETAAELEALKRLGVSYAIGHHIGLPQAASPRPARAMHEPVELEPRRQAPEILLAPFEAAPEVLETVQPHQARGFGAVVTAVLRGLADEYAKATALLGHLDARQDVYRIVDLAGPAAGHVAPGSTVAPAQSPASRLLAGELGQRVADLRRDISGAELEMTARLGAASWMCVPLALRGGEIVATLEVSAPVPRRFVTEDLRGLQRLAGVVLEALTAEIGAHDARTAEGALRALAWGDPLTGLVNGTRFAELLERENRRIRTEANAAQLVLASVVNGEAVAQLMGRGLGDLLVKDVARTLQEHAGPRDVLARIAPFTFACLLFGWSELPARSFCDQIEAQVADASRRRAAVADLRAGQHPLGTSRPAHMVLRLASLDAETRRRP